MRPSLKPKSAVKRSVGSGVARVGQHPSLAPAPEEPMPYAPGDLVASKFRLIDLVGEGGMGSVWRAHNEVLDVDVALNLIRREVATPETSARLLREARAVAHLRHT